MSRLIPDLDPNAGINREEVAMLFGFPDDPDAGMRTLEVAAAKIPFSERVDAESGETEYRLGDIETIVREWKRRPRRPTPPDSVMFTDEDDELEAVLLSDDASGRGTKGIRVADAAKQAGLTEDEMSARLLGAVQLRVVEGDLCVGLDDLNRLRKEGKISKVTSSTEPAKAEPIDNPLAPPVDPAVEARTKAVAASMGIDLSPATSSTKKDKPAPASPSGATIVRADEGDGYRLGRPRRWGQP